MATLEAAQEVCINNANLQYIDENNQIYPISVKMADGAIDVRIYDLPPEMDNVLIKHALSIYGTVHMVSNEKWSNNVKFQILSGVRIANMVVEKPIQSFLNIEEFKTLVTYPNQIPTCFHCSEPNHVGQKCPQKSAPKDLNSAEVRSTYAHQVRKTPVQLPQLATRNQEEERMTVLTKQTNTPVYRRWDDEVEKEMQIRQDNENSKTETEMHALSEAQSNLKANQENNSAQNTDIDSISPEPKRQKKIEKNLIGFNMNVPIYTSLDSSDTENESGETPVDSEQTKIRKAKKNKKKQ